MSCRALLIVLALTSLSSAAFAESPEERASRSFQDGAALYARGEYRAAARAFSAAFRLVPRGPASYNAGLAWQEANERARAANAFERALGQRDLDATQVGDARARLAALAPTLGRLSVSAPPGRVSVAFVDGEPTPLRVYLDPGVARVRLEKSDGSLLETSVTLVAGRQTEADFSVRAPSPAERGAAPPAAEGPPASAKTWGFVSLGVGVAASGAAIYLGTRALAARDDYDNSGNTDPGARDRARSLRLWTNVAWGAAIVAGGVGVTLILTAPKTPTEPSTALVLGPAGVAVSRRF